MVKDRVDSLEYACHGIIVDLTGMWDNERPDTESSHVEGIVATRETSKRRKFCMKETELCVDRVSSRQQRWEDTWSKLI